ncbi:hypothetical protein V6N13_037851 [Hibiscus sabdariffa]
MLWKHKSRRDWVKFGDRNTRYFHSKVVLKRRRKSICSLRINDGEWCDDESTLREVVVSYYAGLFSTNGSPPLMFPISGLFPSISDGDFTSLDSIPQDSEIKEALFVMAPLKAPGFDGLHA